MKNYNIYMQTHPPLTYFGSKRTVAGLIWQYLGDVDKFIDTFGGSFSTLLGRPNTPKPNQDELMNDFDGRLVNFWRAMKYDGVGLAKNVRGIIRSSVENWSRAATLKANADDLVSRLSGDPNFYDMDMAVNYLYVNTNSIAGSSTFGSWGIEDGMLKKIYPGGSNKGIAKSRINIKRINYLNMTESEHLRFYEALQKRLQNVMIVCGSWDALLESFTAVAGGNKDGNWTTGIVFDPPYNGDDHVLTGMYENHPDNISAQVRNKALELVQDHRIRICICGYIEEHDEHLPSDWIRVPWTASLGYAAKSKVRVNTNRFREMLWFSPSCIDVTTNQQKIFS